MKTTEIKTKIAERISNSSEEVSNTVVNELANIEIARRTSIITESVRVIEKMEKKQADLEVADVVTFDKDGVKQEVYSEQRFNQIKEIKESIAKIYQASDNALKENNEEVFQKLQEVLREESNKF
jgi:Flp pilus assembly CpaE family ATPase